MIPPQQNIYQCANEFIEVNAQLDTAFDSIIAGDIAAARSIIDSLK